MAISGTFSKDNIVKFNDETVEVSLDGGSTWEGAIESWATQVEFQRGEVETGAVKTLDGLSHVTPGASLGPGKAIVTVLYTEGATEPFKNINDAFTANPGLAAEIKWSPAGGATADYLFTTDGGYMTACTLPQGDASDNESGRFTFTIDCDDAAQTDVPA